MNTIIIAQNEPKIKKTLAQYREPGLRDIRVGGKRLKRKLRIEYTPEILGGISLGSPDKIVAAIVQFADQLATVVQEDRIEFQVIFIFHQTTKRTAERIILALADLNKNKGWRNLPYKHTKHIRVPQVVLLSCESATDEVNKNPYEPRLLKYDTQAYVMRMLADRAFKTPMAPPPQTPPGVYAPAVITFSTGNPVTGGLVLDPFRIAFRKLHYHLDKNGNFVEDPRPPGVSEEEWHKGDPSGGTVHVYHNGKLSGKKRVKKGKSLNVMGYPPP